MAGRDRRCRHVENGQRCSNSRLANRDLPPALRDPEAATENVMLTYYCLDHLGLRRRCSWQKLCGCETPICDGTDVLDECDRDAMVGLSVCERHGGSGRGLGQISRRSKAIVAYYRRLPGLEKRVERLTKAGARHDARMVEQIERGDL